MRLSLSRWYPRGKIVFMAPTKPLVGQQIEACFKVMGIPQSDTVEMTGEVGQKDRVAAWKHKVVYSVYTEPAHHHVVYSESSSSPRKC